MPLSETILNRRKLLWALILGLMTFRAEPVQAKNSGDGDSDGGDGRDDRGDGHNGRDDDDSRDDGDTRDRDKDAIRNAVRKGEAAPLRDILSMVRKSYRGEVVSASGSPIGRAISSTP